MPSTVKTIEYLFSADEYFQPTYSLFHTYIYSIFTKCNTSVVVTCCVAFKLHKFFQLFREKICTLLLLFKVICACINVLKVTTI